MLFDIGTGILIAIGTSWFFDVELTRSLIVMGIFLVLVPDFDFLVELVKHGSVGGREIREHRQISHFPLTYVPVIIIIFLLWGPMWASFVGLCLLAHFLHDSMGIGWGIMWLWPFSHKAFKCFSEKNGAFSLKLFVAWNPEEVKKLVAGGDPNWFHNIYMRAHPINVIEFMWFVGSLVVLYFFLY